MSRVPRHAEGRSAMVWALVVLGVLTLVFGAFVLLRFPDRPGGTIKFQGTEVRSKGAGLPLRCSAGRWWWRHS